MRRSCLLETSDRRLRVQSRPVRSPTVKSGAVAAALMVHGGAVAMLLLIHPLPKLDPVPEAAVEVVLFTPAPPEEEAAPVAAQAPAVPTAAGDLAEEQHADTSLDTAAPQGRSCRAGRPPSQRRRSPRLRRWMPGRHRFRSLPRPRWPIRRRPPWQRRRCSRPWSRFRSWLRQRRMLFRRRFKGRLSLRLSSRLSRQRWPGPRRSA